MVDVSSIPKGRISRLLTVDSKIALGAFKGGEPLSLCYDRILNIPTEKFPTSLLDVTFALDEAVSLMPGLSTGESSSLDDNFATRVALSFDVAAARRDKNRQETAKNKVQHIAMAQERRRQQTEEIRSHKTAVRIAAVQEKERQKEREAELDRCRSEAYIAEQRKSDALRNHERSLAQAAVHGKNDARFERLLKSVRHSEKLAQEAEKQGRRKKVCPRVSTRRSKSVHVDAAARGRCAKNAKRSREERTRLVTKAYDALRVAEKSIHDAIGVPYSDENAYRKVLKTRDFVLGAMSQLSGLIEPGLTET